MTIAHMRSSLMAATPALVLVAATGLLAACGGEDAAPAASAAAAPQPAAVASHPPESANETGILAAVSGILTITAPPLEAGPFSVGVQTHLSQGWPASTLTQAQQMKVLTLRDSVPWTINEKSPGVYNFSNSQSGAIAKACSLGMKVIVTLPPQNPLYDGGKMVHSEAGKAAYANYLKAVLGQFGSCIEGIEVGNEINGAGAPAMLASGMDMTTTYMGVLRAIDAIVRPAYPNVKILGGSTNMIGTGFLNKLFAAGMLPLVDGVVVHPYRTQAVGVDMEIGNLIGVMRNYGTPKPVYATEWAHDTPDQALAAGELIKQVTLMSVAGVRHASWYALLDQTAFPNMGLFTGTALKQQGRAFELLQRTVLPKGRPQREKIGDALFFAYRFGADSWVVWGSPRTITTSGQAYSATGAALGTGSVAVGPSPIVITGGAIESAGTSNLVADTLLGWGSGQWSYIARTGTTKQYDIALGLVDDQYSSYFGSSNSKPLRINSGSANPGGNATSPIRTVLRYTSTAAQSLDLFACLLKKGDTGDGIDYRVTVNGAVQTQGVTTGPADVSARLTLKPGDKVDFVVGPNQTYGGDNYNFRIQLFRSGTGSAPICG